MALLIGLAASTCRADDAEEAGLRLADEAPPVSARGGDLQLSLEPAWSWTRAREGGSMQPSQRLSVDLAWQAPLGAGWRLTVADRIDLHGPSRPPGARHAVNTWKETFASGPIDADTTLDVGRVNARFGVATAYNPTDHFRDHAVREATSIDPASLRENRLGAVMLRAQRLWPGGSLLAIWAPKLSDAPNGSGLAADVGATNHRTRWLLAWTQRWAEDLAPQWLVKGDDEPGNGPQLGLNLTRLVNRACVGHLEWNGGRMASQGARAANRPRDDMAFRTQWAVGGTCANAANMSFTFEYQRDGTALDRRGWQQLRDGPMPPYLAYRRQAQERQDLPSRDNLFLMVRWQNALVPRLDLNGIVRHNVADRSRIGWLEARYRLDRTDLALQWQSAQGRGLTEYGATAWSQTWQVLLRHYF